MKKVKSSLLAGMAALALLFPYGKDSQLKDIAKPYLGTYECRQATLGSRDLLKEFSHIVLELKDEENFTLIYKTKTGENKKIEGKYAYDVERKTLTLTENDHGIKGEFPLENGRLTLSFAVGNKRCILRFEQ